METNKHTTTQFVVLPKKENGELLQKYEILVYVALRRYMNKTTMKAYPSLDRIQKDTGCSIPTIRKIIQQIVNKGYMSVEINPGIGTIYTFNNEKSFEPFSYEFLDNPELTKAEKLQILCTQQFMFKENGIGKVSYSDNELAEKTGLNRHTIAKTTSSLIEKGFATQVTLKTKNPETGLINKETIYNLNKIGQAIVFALNDHEWRISETEKEIASLKKDKELLLRELEELKKQLLPRIQKEYPF